jgi:hypothetical protein
VFLINGLFYGVEGMSVGGTRRLKISPQLGYGERGVPGVIPPNSVLNAEITILEERNSSVWSRRVRLRCLNSGSTVRCFRDPDRDLYSAVTATSLSVWRVDRRIRYGLS